MTQSDPSTLSNYKTLKVNHTSLKLSVHWDKRTISGTVTYDLEALREPEIVLDTRDLVVKSAHFDTHPIHIETLPEQAPFGTPIRLGLHSHPKHPATAGKLVLEFETTEKCTALQWLEPEQTAGKVAPYLFSQCEAIHARSIFPSFDTPAVKTPYDIEIQSVHPVVTSGVVQHEDKANGVYKFAQEIPIPAYLFSIAGGDLSSASIGPRSHVYTEPSQLAAAKYEFEYDMEKFLEAAEKIVFDYKWKTYDLLVLPPSFPFGGMENPNMTFVTPTLVSGDRTLVNVVAHELAHSWSGNLVTNASWEHFWLNEGWTVYLERRILAALHGEAFRHFHAIIGWKELEEAVHQLPQDYTRLVLEMKGIDPDDTFSTVPYEKGSTFLFYLENHLGREKWNKFIPFYFRKFEGKSLDSYDFKDTLYEFFQDAEDKARLDSVDWDTWFYAPGLPPRPNFDTTLAEPCYELASKWAAATESGSFEWASPSDIANWDPAQLLVFLDTLAGKLDNQKHIEAAIQHLDQTYKVSSATNSETKLRWFRLAIAAKFQREYEPLSKWLTTNGRMKYVRPGYRQLASVDRELAVSTFKAHEKFYHPIAQSMIRKDLGLA